MFANNMSSSECLQIIRKPSDDDMHQGTVEKKYRVVRAGP
jgi:hypothetical protein